MFETFNSLQLLPLKLFVGCLVGWVVCLVGWSFFLVDVVDFWLKWSISMATVAILPSTSDVRSG